MIERLTIYIKDFIIYIVPGIIINYCVMTLANVTNPIESIKNNNIGLLWIIISFMIGFFVTQFQIIMFHKLRKRPVRFEDVISDENVKKIIKRNIRHLLKTVADNDEVIENKIDFRMFCYQYVLNYGTDHIINLIFRADALFIFAISIYLPTMLAIITLLFILKYNLILSVLIFFLSITLITLLLKKIITFFNMDKERKIYHSFLVTSSSEIAKT